MYPLHMIKRLNLHRLSERPPLRRVPPAHARRGVLLAEAGQGIFGEDGLRARAEGRGGGGGRIKLFKVFLYSEAIQSGNT